MPKFMLILYDNPGDFSDLSPDQMQKVIEEYGAWAKEMGKKGLLAGGHKLKHEGGKVIRRDGKSTRIIDGPYSESKEVLAGIFIIEARNYAQATEVAETCPHMKYGAKIDLREIDAV